MKVWNKLSVKSKYYLICFLNLGLWWGGLALIDLSFINLIFFLTAFIWHFALMTPGLKEQVLARNDRYSFLAVAVRINYYLQLFINFKKVPYASSFIRAISPVLFTLLLFLVGGRGNLLFTLLGSFAFELVYVLVKNKTHQFPSSPLVHTSDPGIPVANLPEEKSHE